MLDILFLKVFLISISISHSQISPPKKNNIFLYNFLGKTPSVHNHRVVVRFLFFTMAEVGDLYACPTPNCSFRVALEVAGTRWWGKRWLMTDFSLWNVGNRGPP